ncbi:MAG: thioredoxin domain-containing protein [Bdellovibrionales bacterium]|nr:thioredoxin domain-containing protein [Bdellovibrionales bacterium]
MRLKVFSLSQILSILTLGYLTKIHFDLKYGSGGESLCNINQVLNCDVVNASQFASLFGIPVSLLGVLANFFVLCLGASAAMQMDFDRKSRLLSLTRLAMLPIVAASIVWGTISVTQLHAYCLFCITAYALSFVSFFAIFKHPDLKSPVGDSIQYLLSPQGRWAAYLALGLAVLAPVSNGALKNQFNPLKPDIINEIVENWKVSPEFRFDIQNAFTLNEQDSPKMTLIEFADFLCIHCKHAHPMLHTFVQSHPDVKFVYMTFALDGDCNEAIGRSGGGRSCRMAAANICAYRQGKGEQMQKRLFEIFHDYTDEDAQKLSAELGLDDTKFKECINSDETMDFIKSQGKAGKDAGIQGTPTIFINGKKLEYGNTWQVLEAAYNSL